MRSYPVNENYIGSVVSDNLRYKETEILLLYYKDWVCVLLDLRNCWTDKSLIFREACVFEFSKRTVCQV